MNDFLNRIRPNWPQTLEEVLTRAQALGPKGVLAFDLDSTLFDNKPRQARILREFGIARDIAPLAKCEAKHWTSGWEMREAMQRCGLSEAEANALFPEAKRFWQERFFTSEYCVDDEAIEGAVDFVKRCLKTGSQLCYVTGRHDAMREGSIAAMRKIGLPLPGSANVQLIMKPDLSTHDDDFKRDAHAMLSTLGTLVAAFDNEPMHVNDYWRKFPGATCVHLVTDHSGRPVQLADEIVSIPSFAAATVAHR